MDYIRTKQPGGLYFFTVVTFNRRKFLTAKLARNLLRQTFKEVKEKHPFEIGAICLLPDHLHCIWRLPPDDCDYPKRWRLIKGTFSRRYLKSGGQEGFKNQSGKNKREAAIWQRRYWEHVIRDDADFQKHFDYIHFNPVKHGYVNKPHDWKWSSFQRYYKLGYYPDDWGCRDFNYANENTFGE